jgi:hypothetical protein
MHLATPADYRRVIEFAAEAMIVIRLRNFCTSTDFAADRLG